VSDRTLRDAWILEREVSQMSVYTEAEHAIALTDTLAWQKKPPQKPEEYYQYGQYQFRLKDYNEAYTYFTLAAEKGYGLAWFHIGECIRREYLDEGILTVKLTAEQCYQKAWENLNQKHAVQDMMLYQRACMLRYGLGTSQDTQKAYEIFQNLCENYQNYTEKDFVVNTEYTIRGSVADKDTTPCKSLSGSVLFELANYKAEGIMPELKNIQEARKLLKKSYDFHCEDALFLDYEIRKKEYDTYEYQNDIRQLYSFRIGQYGRITDVHPTKKAYLRLIEMYEAGYPGNQELRDQEFKAKAEYFRKKLKEKEFVK